MTPVRKTRVELSPCPPASPGPGGPPVLALGRWEALCTGLRLRPPGGSAPPCPRAGCPAGTHLTQAGAGGPRPQVRRLTGEPADLRADQLCNPPWRPTGFQAPHPRPPLPGTLASPCGRLAGSREPAGAGCPGPAGNRPVQPPTRGMSRPGPGWLPPASAREPSSATAAGHRSAAGPPVE